ncbi:MAG: hypothetical protein U0165_02105 [Polyangiaceae bacterium]
MVRCVEAFHLGLTASMMDSALALDAVVRATPPSLIGIVHQRRIEAFRSVPLDRLFEGAYRIVGDPAPPPNQPEAQFAWAHALYQRVPAAIGADWLGVGGWRLGLCIGMLWKALRIAWLAPDAASVKQIPWVESAVASLVQVKDLFGTLVSETSLPQAVRQAAERFLTLTEKIVFISHSAALAGDNSVLSEVVATVEKESFEPSLLHSLSMATLPLRDAPSESKMAAAEPVKAVGTSDSTVPAEDLLRVIDAVQRAAHHEFVPGLSVSMARTSAHITTWVTLRSSGEVEQVKILPGVTKGSAPEPQLLGHVEPSDFQRVANELMSNRFETIALPPGLPPVPPTVPPVQLLVRFDRDVVLVEIPASLVENVPGFAQIVARFDAVVKKAENLLGSTVAAPPTSLPNPPPPLRVRVVLKYTLMRYVAQGAYVPSGEQSKTWFLRVPGPWFESYEPRARIDEALQRIFKEENARMHAAEPNDPNHLAITSFEVWVVTHADASKRPWEALAPTWERSVCWGVDDSTCQPLMGAEF